MALQKVLHLFEAPISSVIIRSTHYRKIRFPCSERVGSSPTKDVFATLSFLIAFRETAGHPCVRDGDRSRQTLVERI